MFSRKLELGTIVYFADISGENNKYTVEVKTGKIISIGNKKYMLEVDGSPNKLLDSSLVFKKTLDLKLVHKLPLSEREQAEYYTITGNWISNDTGPR